MTTRRRRRLRCPDLSRLLPGMPRVFEELYRLTHAQRWNPIVSMRAFVAGSTGACPARSVRARALNCISAIEQRVHVGVLREGVRPDTPYVADDIYWVLEAHRRNLGRPSTARRRRRHIQEPTTIIRTSRTAHGHVQESSARRFAAKDPIDPAYGGLIFDFDVVHPIYTAILAFLVVMNHDDPARLGHRCCTPLDKVWASSARPWLAGRGAGACMYRIARSRLDLLVQPGGRGHQGGPRGTDGRASLGIAAPIHGGGVDDPASTSTSTKENTTRGRPTCRRWRGQPRHRRLAPSSSPSSAAPSRLAAARFRAVSAAPWAS